VLFSIKTTGLVQEQREYTSAELKKRHTRPLVRGGAP
jgi:hypothetical protein